MWRLGFQSRGYATPSGYASDEHSAVCLRPVGVRYNLLNTMCVCTIETRMLQELIVVGYVAV